MNKINRRTLDGGGGSEAHADPLLDKIDEQVDAFNAIKSGTAIIALGSSSIEVPIGAALDGKPATATVMQAAADGTLTHVTRCSWDGGGNLTIHGNANATAAVTVAYHVDGR